MNKFGDEDGISDGGIRTPERQIRTAPFAGPLAELNAAATSILLRRGQKLGFETAAADSLFLLRVGILQYSLTLPGKHRQVLLLLYPGDVLRVGDLPRSEGGELVAASSAEVGRLRPLVAKPAAAGDPPSARALEQRLTAVQSRSQRHALMLGTLSSEERVASLLVEMGLRLGYPTGTSIVIEPVLSRSDIADYLSLNADTLSRVMSRLRVDGLINTVGRDRIIVRRWSDLCALTPLAEMLRGIALA